ncbi:MAG: phosphoribosylglycinamide formyltransferase [Eubacteriaceae bacterium]|jgi:phosphoribosylglycinamide formyltransferase-1|nr:phosphoribosylglycinamide formyltransferase [Eubacteriaceae bacterium]
MKKMAVLASGSGSNLQALIDRVHEKEGLIAVVISNKKNAYALKRAKKADIPAIYADRSQVETDEAYDTDILKILHAYAVDVIVLAGYLRILTPVLTEAYANRIINIHPSLIPSFCGDGYYGMHVHQAVYDRGVKITGATVHFVDSGVDTGPIIMQRAVCLTGNEQPEEIAAKVLEIEHELLVESVTLVLNDQIEIVQKRTIRK